MPECLVYADALRLQQVFDNIFANSYKYAGTDITVEVKPTDVYPSATLNSFNDFLNIS